MSGSGSTLTGAGWEGSYREFSPLDHLVSRVPHLGRLGRQQDLTSLTGSPEFLALGTSCGSVYWYNRREDSLQRLDCWPHTAVTSLALVETTHLMLAVGSEQGDLTIFQIPKPVLTDIGVPFPGTTQDIQEFSIRNVHTGSRISALCWATNGERLFSGDTAGRLVMSVVDFFKNTVQTSLMSVESGQILALSYLHRTLLVSSAWETAVLDLSQTEDQRRRVKVGGGETTRASTLLEVGVGRPGLRCLLVRPGNSLTVTDTGGTPVRDLPLSEELTRQQREIPLVNPVSIAREEEGEQMDNIRVLSVQDQTVLLWSKVSLHLVSLLTGSVVASCRSLRNILDLAVTSSGEILVLESPRSVVRLGLSEDSLAPATDWRRGRTVSQAADTQLESALHSVGANITSSLPRFPLLNSLADSLTSELRGLKEKLKGPGREERGSSPAEEVVEAIIGLDYSKAAQTSAEVSPVEVRNLLDSEFKTRMDRIGEAEFTADIVQQRSPRRYKKVRSIRENSGDTEETDQYSGDQSPDIKTEIETPNTTASSDIAGVSDEVVTELTTDQVNAEEKELALMKILCIQQEEEEEEEEDVVEPEVTQPASVPDVDTNNTETSLASIGYGPPSDSVEHRSLPSLGREEPALTSQSGQFPDFRPGEEREMESLAVTETENWLSYEVLGLAVSLVEARLVRAELPSHSLPSSSSPAECGTALVSPPSAS